ncbi:hypothetical protein AB0B57_16400 [Micromonospora sp. NPDC049101]|uniref:hypothetical protein n=1 Tax=Micromonospora sp. NPDC049101 TaxID=3155032 RepID=UPI0033EAEBA6
MAVRIDIDALRDAAGPVVCAAADKLQASDQPVVPRPAGGGVSGEFHEAGQPPVDVWVGITADGFTAECDCAAAEELCAHAVALTAAALDDGFTWSSAATPPSALAVDPRVAELAEVASSIPARRLALLVAEWAATDRVLESRLRAQAG